MWPALRNYPGIRLDGIRTIRKQYTAALYMQIKKKLVGPAQDYQVLLKEAGLSAALQRKSST